MRPRFELPLAAGGPRTLEALRELLREDGCPCQGIVTSRHAELNVCERDRHFWSPQLSLEVVTDEDDTELLRGRFGPHPHVWGMFMVIYGVLALGGVAGLMYGISQWMLDRTPWALLAVPAAGALGLFVYGATFIGQGLGAEQMYVLRKLVDDALEHADPG